MDIEYIKLKLNEIKDTKADCEAAHRMEDDLYKEFVVWLANDGANGLHQHDIQKLAALIQTSKNIKFSRWYA